MKTITTILCLTILSFAFTQDAKSYYEQGIEKAQAGKTEEAIPLFSKAIELDPKDHFSWYNRGIANLIQSNYDEALVDMNEVIKLSPEYKKAYLNRGRLKRKLTDYEGANQDFSAAIRLDAAMADAYYERALLYDLLGQKEMACTDFNSANKLGHRNAQRKVDKCKDTLSGGMPVNTILRLTKEASDKNYGLTEENPVKVGTGTEGGPENQRIYLELLRDPQGKPVRYRRLASCCSYKSEHGLMGIAMMDKYEISYSDEKGKAKTAVLYLTFYDYEEPQIPHGFKTISKP